MEFSGCQSFLRGQRNESNSSPKNLLTTVEEDREEDLLYGFCLFVSCYCTNYLVMLYLYFLVFCYFILI